jgi:hypothetical protein
MSASTSAGALIPDAHSRLEPGTAAVLFIMERSHPGLHAVRAT